MSRSSRPAWLLAAGLVVVLAGGLLGASTDSGPERFLRERLGLTDSSNPLINEPCTPDVRASSPWRREPPLPVVRDEPRAVALGGKIYLMGGVVAVPTGEGDRRQLRSTARVSRFDPARGTYAPQPPLPVPVDHMGAVVHDGWIYVVGGLARRRDYRGSEHDGLYRWRPGQRRWRRLAPMPTAREAPAAAVLGDRIFVAGGRIDERATRRVESYGISSGRWRAEPAMPTAREHTSGASVGGAMYVVGGRSAATDALAAAERFDPERRRWEQVDSLPVPSGGLEVLGVDGQVVAIGGGDDRGGTVTGAVQAYDPERGRWRLAAPMRTPRHGFGAAWDGERIFALGGSPCARFAATDVVESLEWR